MLRQIATQLKKPSGFFGTIMSNLMIQRNRNAYKTLLKELKIQPTDRLLEIGFGPGWGIYTYAKQYETSTFHGIDFSQLMYQRASKKNKQFIDNKRVSLQFGDFIEVEISKPDFDKIYCLNVIYFWNNLSVPFQKIYSLLKNGGSFHIYMTGPEELRKNKFADDIFNKYSIVQVVDAIKNAGFNEIDFFGEKEYFIRAKK